MWLIVCKEYQHATLELECSESNKEIDRPETWGPKEEVGLEFGGWGPVWSRCMPSEQKLRHKILFSSFLTL